MKLLMRALAGALAVLATTTNAQTIVDVAVGDDQFSTLVVAVTAAGLADTLASEGPFTVFAPTNDAFIAKVDYATLAQLLEPEWNAHLNSLLLYHVVKGAVMSTDLMDESILPTLSGRSATVNVSVSDDGVMINDATVVAADVEAENGVIHVIDSVLIPPNLQSNIVGLAASDDQFSTLVSLVVAANLTEALSAPYGGLTLFAPTNDAFAQLDEETVAYLTSEEGKEDLTNILLYHVVPGNVFAADLEDGNSPATVQGSDLSIAVSDDGTVTINNSSNVLLANVLVSNGVIHVVDQVLIPPSNAAPPVPMDDDAMEEMDAEMEGDDDTEATTIVDLAVATADLSTLVDLVTLAELVETLSGEGPFTVFAPTNEAFLALDAALVTALTEDPSGALTDVLLYHVVPGTILSTDLVDGAVVTTVGGNNVTVSVDADGGAMINNANVVFADVVASNGVVHIIDAVLIPSSDAEEETAEEETPDEETMEEETTESTIVDLAVATEDLSSLVDLVVLAELVETLSGEGPFTVFAPTNDAIAALDSDLVTALTDDPSGALTDVLLYHVVSGTILSTDLEDGAIVETVGGKTVEVSLGDDGAMINDANVVIADVIARNGVVHVIDKVLIPPTEAAEDGEEDTDPEDDEKEDNEGSAGTDAEVEDEEEDTPSNDELFGGYKRIKSVALTAEDACIEVDGALAKREKLILGRCRRSNGGWRLEDSGLLRTELATYGGFCMQADFDPEVGEGKPIRTMPCDPEEPLQQFVFAKGEGIRTKSNTDFCVHWRGVTANRNDPIILKACDEISDLLDWEFV